MNNGKGFFDYDIGKAFAGFSFPNFDVESVLASQRKNLEAFTQANQVAVEGVQALAKRQVEIVTAAVEEASAALRDLTAPGAVDEKLAKNAELAKAAYEKVLPRPANSATSSPRPTATRSASFRSASPKASRSSRISPPSR